LINAVKKGIIQLEIANKNIIAVKSYLI